MARIGIRNFRYSVLTEDENGAPVYAGAQTPRHAISCKVAINSNDAKLYGDDVLIESDRSFKDGTVTIGLDDDDQTTMAALLGHTVTSDAMKRSANDLAPYVGIGHIVTKRVDGADKFKVEFLYKVRFGEPSQENTTKGESIEFGTYELEGRIHALANGDWSITKTFSSYSDALAYLEGLMAAPTVVSGTP